MKLADLRSAIRTTKGNPSVSVELAGTTMVLPLQKTPLLAALGEAFNDARTAETGMTFDVDTGLLSAEGAAAASFDLEDDAPATKAPAVFDLDL